MYILHEVMITAVFSSQLQILERRNFDPPKRNFVSWKRNYVSSKRYFVAPKRNFGSSKQNFVLGTRPTGTKFRNEIPCREISFRFITLLAKFHRH